MQYMRHILLLLIFSYTLSFLSAYSQTDKEVVNLCVSIAGDDVIYLKDFLVELPGVSENNRPPIAKNSVILRKNTTYRFTICNRDNSEGEGIIQLFDTRRMIASSYNPKTGKIYQSINFQCTMTGPYSIFISFKDGKKGSAVGILSYVKKSKP